jgi:nicotinamide-nucleotide amidase
MAEGALARSKADLALAVTGFAGPAGEGCEEGLVHMAVARRGGTTLHREAHFGAAGRGPVRLRTLECLLQMLEDALEQR